MRRARISADRQAVCVGATDADRRRSKRDGLDHIGSGADAAIEQHRRIACALDHVGKHVDRGDTAIRLPATVIGAIDRIDPVIGGLPRILPMADTLQHDRQIGQASEPCDVVPGQHLAEHLRPHRDGGRRIVFGRAVEKAAKDRIAEIVFQNLAAQLRETGRIEIAGAPAGHPCIECDDDRAIACVLRTREQAGRQILVLGGVELEEARHVAGCCANLFHRAVRKGRGAEWHAGSGRSAGGGQIASAILRHFAVQTDRSHEDRRWQLQAEQVDRQIAFGTIDQHARHHSPMAKRLRIAILRVFVAAAALHVIQQRRGKRLLRASLQRSEIDRIIG